jgi:L-asparaginase
MERPRIVHLAGPTATIQNTPPLVTSNKARAKYGLPLKTNPDGSSARFDVLRAQRLAAPVTVYVEQFSAHPLEADRAELYGPPDGYLDRDGRFHEERQGPGDTPVYAIELQPGDGLYPLPYVARQANGAAWEEECAYPGAPEEQARQGFFPDGSRPFEEIDRLMVGVDGWGNQISAKADVEFARIMPPGGYTKGLAAARRTDRGDGDIPPERRGFDFFAYKPAHLAAPPTRDVLARATNRVQQILGEGRYLGAVWTEGSPNIEETIYWLNLLIDTTAPIAGNAAQRVHGMISNDGPKNIVDSADYICSRVWADAEGRDRVGAVLIQEQQIFSARTVAKSDARPGNYRAVGGNGGILGAVGHDAGAPILHFIPTTRHTWCSAVNRTRLPREVGGWLRRGGLFETVRVPIKDAGGELVATAIPPVAILKDGAYTATDGEIDISREPDLLATIDYLNATAPLAGLVFEGLTPYGSTQDRARNRLIRRALYSGLPVVRVGRGATEGFVPARDACITGANLTATKARILLMAALMKLGSLTPAADPDHPTAGEEEVVHKQVQEYQAIFDTH